MSFLDLLKLYTSVKFCGFPHYVACTLSWAHRDCLVWAVFLLALLPPVRPCLKNQSAVYCMPAALRITGCRRHTVCFFSMTGFRRRVFFGRSKLTKTELTNRGTTPFVILVVIIILVLLKGVCQLKTKNYFGLYFLHKRKIFFLCTKTSALCIILLNNTVYCVISFFTQFFWLIIPLKHYAKLLYL